MPIYDAHECAVNTSLAVIPSARSWRRRRRCLVLVAVMAGAAAQAADAPAPAAGAADKLSAARAQVAAKRWPEALTELRQLGDGTSADWNTLMGYVLRKSSPPDLDGAERHYGEALRIDPQQRGALEYSGELALIKGDLPRAEQRLAALDKACMFGCEEYSDLKEAVKRYKAAGNRYSPRN